MTAYKKPVIVLVTNIVVSGVEGTSVTKLRHLHVLTDRCYHPSMASFLQTKRTTSFLNTLKSTRPNGDGVEVLK